MKLSDIFELTRLFGYDDEEIRRRLAMGDSPYNAWEGFKLELQIRWNEMNQELGVDRLNELRTAYDRLQGLTLSSAKKRSEVAAENKARFAKMADRAQSYIADRGRRNLASFFEAFEQKMQETAKEEPNNPRVKDAIDKMKDGKLPF